MHKSFVLLFAVDDIDAAGTGTGNGTGTDDGSIVFYLSRTRSCSLPFVHGKLIYTLDDIFEYLK